MLRVYLANSPVDCTPDSFLSCLRTLAALYLSGQFRASLQISAIVSVGLMGVSLTFYFVIILFFFFSPPRRRSVVSNLCSINILMPFCTLFCTLSFKLLQTFRLIQEKLTGFLFPFQILLRFVS